MAKTATREIHRDDSPMFTGTHKLADVQSSVMQSETGSSLLDEDGNVLLFEDSSVVGSSYLYDKDACFRSLGVDPDLELYCENETQGTSGTVTVATDDTVTVDGVLWYYGDTYNIYKTSTKNSFISGTWCDVSRGFKINHPDEINRYGWRLSDWDIDDRGRKRVFGPGQPR